MSSSTTKIWETLRTAESKEIEKRLRRTFQQADAYRYNSASIRIRVIDPQFEGMSRTERDGLVEKVIDQLPPETQQDIVALFVFAPSELSSDRVGSRELFLNAEFENPSPSQL